MSKKKKRVRKPGPIRFSFGKTWTGDEFKVRLRAVYPSRNSPKKLRKLANWLNRAADWIEQQESEG